MSTPLHETKTVKVDIFDIPADQVDEYMKDREACAEAATEVMKKYCVTVKRETIDPKEGEGIFGYHITGEIMMSVMLDPFEIPVMKEAMRVGHLEKYILEANAIFLDEDGK